MIIHKEGRSLLLFLFAFLFVTNWLLVMLLPQEATLHYIVLAVSVILYILILQFFRSPQFPIQEDESHVLAPADGKIVAIEETEEDEYLKSKCYQISIFMSPFNVHVNRMPVAGTISYCKYHKGVYLVAWHPKSSTENERNTVVAKMKDGTEILFRQIAGAMARRIKCYAKTGTTLGQGSEFGFIKFGSRVDVFLPLNSKIKVLVGDKTYGGRSILAELE